MGHIQIRTSFQLISSALALSLAVTGTAHAQARTYQLQGQTFELNDLESVPANELAGIEGTNEVFRKFFAKKYASGTRRGVHPKAHGCLEGTMTVGSDLAEIDRVGIFSTVGKTYRVSARFSNGSPHPERPDIKADSRGFGLKVHDVEGEPLLKNAIGSGGGGTQEFTMNSSDSFFSDSAATYHRFMEIALLETTDFGDAAKNFLIELFKGFHPVLGTRILKAFKKIEAVKGTNPLGLQYYSITAFQHGVGHSAPVVKYSLEPCEGVWTEPTDTTNPNFLSLNLKNRIRQQPACFKFLVQHRTSDSLSVEDPTQPWNVKIAPFREVARIHFPAQELGDEVACERTVINPWNTLPAHKPVGGINRLRLSAYLLSIESRKRTNHY